MTPYMVKYISSLPCPSMSMKVPFIVAEVKKALDNGFCVVIGLQTTGEVCAWDEAKIECTRMLVLCVWAPGVISRVTVKGTFGCRLHSPATTVLCS